MVGREEPNAPSSATAADTMNSEQKRCRKRGDVNARFEVIELFLNRPYMRRPAVAGRRVYREVFCVLPYYRNLTVTWLEQVEVPWSHTIYTKLCLPVVPVESVNLPVLGTVAIRVLLRKTSMLLAVDPVQVRRDVFIPPTTFPRPVSTMFSAAETLTAPIIPKAQWTQQ